MSAIFGIFQRDGAPFDAGALHAARQALAHHARDGAALWPANDAPGERSLGLGYAATWLTPESQNEVQPYYDAAAQLTIVADARLDARPALGQALGLAAAELDGLPDSRLILRAYQRWGKDCPQHLLGDFAFAIWDERQQCLFCARDTAGVRPFLYFLGAGRCAFASDMAGLLELMGEAPRLNLDFVADWMRGYKDTPVAQTFYRDVHKLPPAHALLIDAGQVQRWEYWQPENAPAVRYAKPAEYGEALRDLLTQAVADRLRCAYPIGAHLSGGLDSSSVAVLAARHLRAQGRQPAIFSWSPPPQADDPLAQIDERRRIAIICQAEGLQPRYLHVTPADDCFLEVCDPSMLPEETVRMEYALMQQAAALNVRLLLSGWGGDEVISFNGRGYLSELLLARRFGRLAQQFFQRTHGRPKAMLATFYRDLLLPLLPGSVDERMPFRFARPTYRGLPASVQEILRKQRVRRKEHKTYELPAKGFFQPDFYDALEAAGQAEHISARTRPNVRATQLALLRHGHLVGRIDSWSAHGARFGLQYSYPLLDRRVLEFCLGAPSDIFMEKGRGRHLIRLALQGILPEDLIWNVSKFDMGVFSAQKTPEHKAETHRLRQAIFTQLRARQPHSAEWIDFDHLNRMLETPPTERKHELSSGIWDVLALAFIDARTVWEK